MARRNASARLRARQSEGGTLKAIQRCNGCGYVDVAEKAGDGYGRPAPNWPCNRCGSIFFDIWWPVPDGEQMPEEPDYKTVGPEGEEEEFRLREKG
tara:strand:+ start:94 stop:381 length:288 start_codon:yes stop_codon:yes gene_type:complete